MTVLPMPNKSEAPGQEKTHGDGSTTTESTCSLCCADLQFPLHGGKCSKNGKFQYIKVNLAGRKNTDRLVRTHLNKRLKRIIRKRIGQHLLNSTSILAAQRGYILGKLCLTNPLLFLDKIPESRNEGHGNKVRYAALNRALDSVNRKLWGNNEG